MIKFERKYKIALLGAGLSLVGYGAMAFLFPPNSSDVEVQLKGFAVGTHARYEVIADGNVIYQGQEIMAEGGVINLPPLNNKESKSTGYQLHIDAPTSFDDDNGEISSAETLDLFLGLDRGSDNISVSGSGLNSFDDVVVKKGNKSEGMTADWAGMFSSGSLNKGNGNSFNKIELAFQNFGVASDADYLGAGSVILTKAAPFGESSGSAKAKVQERYVWALAAMAEQLSNVMVLQTEAIGMFFDARIQMQTQRKHQELRARAHKDYHPGEQMCRIGSYMRSLAHADSQGELNKNVLNKMLMNQYLASPYSSADHGTQANNMAKLKSYVGFYCDPRDNNGSTETLCPPSGSKTAKQMDRLNKDIDYTRTIGNKLTVNVNYAGGASAVTDGLLDDEADIIALAKNLYFPNIFELPDAEDLKDDTRAHYNSRSFAAKMNVAHSTFLNIVGMKSKSPEESSSSTTDSSAGWAHMKAMMREFGISDGEIDAILGSRPSYYAQMEVLTKKIYQNPNFYTNLYDKPANVDRVGASLDAISLMHQRDRFESILRREMLTSLLVEEELTKHAEEVTTVLFEEMRNPQNKK